MELRDHPQDVGEQVSRNCDFGLLEGDIASVFHDFCTHFDEFLFERRHRPVFDRLWRRQRAQDVAQICRLGSRLVLLEASCKKCAEQTQAFEEAVLLHALRASRRKLKLRGKKRRRSEPIFALTVVKPDGTESVEWRALDVHPTVLFLPKFDAPGLLAGRPEGQFPSVDQWALLLGGILKSDVNFCSPVMDIAALAQLVAKIAHGFAVWQFGLDGFVPMLIELIRHDFNSAQPHPDQFHLVGGDLRNFAPHTDRLHTLGWGFLETQSKTYLLVAVRMFSYLGGPIYYAIAGYFTEEQLAKARAVSKAHAQASNADQ